MQSNIDQPQATPQQDPNHANAEGRKAMIDLGVALLSLTVAGGSATLCAFATWATISIAGDNTVDSYGAGKVMGVTMSAAIVGAAGAIGGVGYCGFKLFSAARHFSNKALHTHLAPLHDPLLEEAARGHGPSAV